MAANGYYDSVNLNLANQLDPIAGKHVLEVGCASGKLGALLKSRGASHYAGVELVPAVAAEARARLDEVHVGNIEHMVLPFAPGSFDYIVFGDVLEHLVDPWSALRRCTPFLKADGVVVASIPNINHVSIFAGLLGGRWEYTDLGLLDRTHLRFFTLVEIIEMFLRAGLAFSDIISCSNSMPALDALAIDLEALRKKHGIVNDRLPMETGAYQWLVKAHRA